MGAILKSLRAGLRRRSWQGLRAVLASLGAIWLLTELAEFLIEDADEWFAAHRILYLAAIVVASIAAFSIRIYEPRRVRFSVPTTNTNITLKYGDLFAEQADLLIAVNEFFDGELGQVVAVESVHGQFINRFYQSNPALFRAAVDPLLASYVGETVPRPNLPSTRYPIGTTLMVPVGANHAFLVATSNTNVQTHRASSNVAHFWVAITNALETVHHLNNGRPLALPLVGSGRSNLNLEPQHLLRLLVLAIVDTARRLQLPDEITIVLPEACFDKLDLREIAATWRR
jgi:hypothetical protein